MANLSEDIHCASSDTRPPILDRTDFASGQQRIRLYCRGKDNGVNILKSIDEGSFLMGIFWETHAEGNEGGHDNAVDEDVDEPPGQDLVLNVGNVFLADDCDAFDSDVDEASTAQTSVMVNLLSADHVYDETSQSYDSDILSELPDHENYQDAVCEHHEDNAVSVVQSNVSSMPNDACMMIINEMHEPTALSVSANRQHKVVNASLTAELATYKEQVKLYERWAKFELIEREQKIDEQLRIVITDLNIKEENLKKNFNL
nr:hypothetical protein [Tanacetum cinerariifolium]